MSEALRHPAPRDAVFIHGAGETGVLWRGVLENLTGPATALALNLPGHPTGDAVAKSIEDYAAAVHGAMSALRSPV